MPEALIEIIGDMYANLKSRIITDIQGSYFDVRRGSGRVTLYRPPYSITY